MPKTLKNIFDEICSMENLELAYRHAIRNKRYTYGSLLFTQHLMDNLIWIQDDLLAGNFAPGQFREKLIHDPKTRLIMVQPFRDRVSHWAFYQILNPFFTKGYIKDSYACIEGRGQLAAVEELQRWLYSAAIQEKIDRKRWYYLKMDISKFFYRIPHDKLFAEFDRKVSDKYVRAWVRAQLEDTPQRFGLPPGKDILEVAKEDRLADRGTPIGTLPSQMLANMHMNPLDQYAKRVLGLRYYMRYNDDFIVLLDDKKQLHQIKDQLTQFVEERLGLEINPKKTAIRPIQLGVEFCGRKVFPTGYKLRKSTALRVKRNLKGVMKRYHYGELTLQQAAQTVNSYQALLDKGDNQALKKAIFGDENGNGGWFVLKKETMPRPELPEKE